MTSPLERGDPTNGYWVVQSTNRRASKPWVVCFRHGDLLMVAGRHADSDEAEAHASGMDAWYRTLSNAQRNRIWPSDVLSSLTARELALRSVKR